ncbi:Acetylxylan esterase precursor [Polystyrenella longa]|uniref:Acetylxylan esterase n=1 Tax=Polystyrenella longa TaxID=2528007 RepID=A0A518CPV2_9PLAN|nr:alpha/beta hydrolase [Polystyrenella longa]QDU81249.1 Acetylxylan esterase precursor [Polystyrenella longa]
MFVFSRCSGWVLLGSLLFCSGFLSAAENIRIEKEIIYKQVGDQQLQLDLARPADNRKCPAIVFIHGGGWALGHRTKYLSQIQEAAKQGYVAVTISYRLMKFEMDEKDTAIAEPHFPAQIHDVKAAVRWLRLNADKYQIDADHIGAIGDSAGGHLSLMLGLADSEAELEGETENPEVSSQVQAVVNFYGPTEMQACYEASSVAWLMRLFMGGTPAEQPGNYVASSPVQYIKSTSPPVLTFQGELDRLVPIAQARLLDQKMNDAGASHTLVVYPTQKHGFDQEHKQKSKVQMYEFFDQHLKAKPAPVE